jgi:hypothetical protein
MPWRSRLPAGDSGEWLEKGSWSGNIRVRAEPFESLELELDALWFSEVPEPG